MTTSKLTKRQVEQAAARLVTDQGRVERRAASIAANQQWLGARQVKDRYGGRSDMWLWRMTHLDDKFPKPRKFGRLNFWSLDELERYERGQQIG
jgi:hypothetical protein